MKKFFPLLALALLSLFPSAARAQFIGLVGLQTVSAQLAPVGTSCTGSPQTFVVANLGQISHQASATSLATAFTLEIDGTDNSNVAYRISNTAVSFTNASTGSYIAQGFGYYAKVSVVVNCTAGATFSLSYSGGQGAFSQLIGAPGTTPISITGNASQVQGVIAQQQSGAAVNPLINGGLQPAINLLFAGLGLDNFNTTISTLPGVGPNTTVTLGAVPPPSTQNEVAIALSSGFTQISGPTPTILAPWTQAGSLAPGDNSALIGSVLTAANAGTLLKENYQNGVNPPGGGTPASITTITLWPVGTTVRQAINVSSGGATGAVLNNSALMAGIRCTGTIPCNGTLTDTLGDTWVQLVNTNSTGNIPPGQIVFIATNRATAGTPTLTFTTTAGSAATGTIAFLELTGTTASPLVQPAISAQLDQLGAQVVRNDAQFPNQFNCTVTLSSNTTTQLTGCGAPTTINNVPVRLYVTDMQLNTTTGSTTGTIQLKSGTGSNCGTGTANLSAIAYPNTTTGITSVVGTRTPLIAPLQSAICATQASGVAGTTVVEIRGFIAP